MYYPDDVIEEVRLRNDIVSVISDYVKLQRQGSSYVGLCPFHNEKTPSFSVSPDKQLYYCFGCGAGGSVFNFIMEYENYSFQEAVRFLADRAGISLPDEEDPRQANRERDRKSRLLGINRTAAVFYNHQLYSPEGKSGMEYLKGRGLSDESITHFGLGFAPAKGSPLYPYLKEQGISDELLSESGLVQVSERQGMVDKFWNRVIFPIMDVNSKVIGFGGRVLGDAKPKYLNSPETPVFDKSRNLYGLNFARKTGKKVLLLCEGYMDVIALHQAGFTNSVASLGTALTTRHAALLKRYTDEVILTYDSDDAGVRAALRAIPLLKEAGVSSRVLHMEPYKDPDEFIRASGKEAFQERIDQAENSFSFELSVMERSHDMKDPDDKTRFFREVAGRIAESEQEIERENYIEATVERYHTSYDGLRKMVMDDLLEGSPAARIRPRKIERRSEKEDPNLKSQRLLLTWLSEEPKLYPAISGYIHPEDFSEGLYREVAEALFGQLQKGAPDIAKITDHFPEQEEQRALGEIFNTKVPVSTDREKEKAILDTVYKVALQSNERKMQELDPSDLEGMQKLIRERNSLNDLRRMHLSLN